MAKLRVVLLVCMAALLATPASADNRLVGLSQQDLVALLGAPGLTRREVPAQLWQYINEDCVLQVFLFDDSGVVQVTHAEARLKGRALAIMSVGQVAPCLEAMGVIPPQQTVEDVDATEGE